MQIIKGRTVQHSGVHVGGRSVNASQLDRWLGKETTEQLSWNMRDWYGPPIAVSGVPGAVFVHRGGDFRGVLRAGYEATFQDRLADGAARAKRIWRCAPKRMQLVMGTGFSGLADLVSKSEHGNENTFAFSKANNSGPLLARGVSYWNAGPLPPAAGLPPAAPGGAAPTRATTGAFAFNNPLSGNTRYLVRAYLRSSAVRGTLLLYDRIFHVAKTASSTATEAVTGVPTRYQSTTQGAEDSAEGNFLFVVYDSATSAAAHNWTVCLYEDQSGNTGQTLPTLAGVTNNSADDLDHNDRNWFAALAAGDTGIKDLEQMQCSALVTPAFHFAIGHPIAWLPVPLVNVPYAHDAILGSMKLARIFDDAALAFIEPCPTAATSTTFTGTFTTVDG